MIGIGTHRLPFLPRGVHKWEQMMQFCTVWFEEVFSPVIPPHMPEHGDGVCFFKHILLGVAVSLGAPTEICRRYQRTQFSASFSFDTKKHAVCSFVLGHLSLRVRLGSVDRQTARGNATSYYYVLMGPHPIFLFCEQIS